MIDQTTDPAQVTGPEPSEVTMDPNARRLVRRLVLDAGAPRAPDMHAVAGIRQGPGDGVGIVADAARLWGILTGDDVPLSHLRVTGAG